MFLAIKTRVEVNKIFVENMMGQNPNISYLTHELYHQGVRAYIGAAKTLRLEPREAAFYCIYRVLQEFKTLSGKDRLGLEDAFKYKISIGEAEDRLWRALFSEYDEDNRPSWID